MIAAIIIALWLALNVALAWWLTKRVRARR